MWFGHDQVQLSHMTMARVMCGPNPKWPLANFKLLSLFLENMGFITEYCWNFITNMAYSCKIEDYTSITAGGKASK